VDPSAVVKKARSDFQAQLNLAGQWYDKELKPMLGSTGKPMTKKPPNDDPRGPFTRMFTDEELAKEMAEAHGVEGDPQALANLELDLKAGLTERVAEAKARRNG
jgi:hypothetical protein